MEQLADCAWGFPMGMCVLPCPRQGTLPHAGDLPTQESQDTLIDSTAKAGSGHVWVGRGNRREVELSRTDEPRL